MLKYIADKDTIIHPLFPVLLMHVVISADKIVEILDEASRNPIAGPSIELTKRGASYGRRNGLP
jgi:hypothetical protein